jgi:uncharacterized protein (TIGR02452 family)
MSKSLRDRGAARADKQRIAQETLSICASGSYSLASEGQAPFVVSIATQLEQAIDSTILYRPCDALPSIPGDAKHDLKIVVRNEDTLAGARYLVEKYSLQAAQGPAVLNFASAKNPGGGFLSGATAQEESLARCSGLYKCQIKLQQEFYDMHKCARDEATRLCLYSSAIIYSPAVPVFRSSDLALLQHPFSVSFLTCPALNMSNASRVGVSLQQGKPAMLERATRVLQVMRAHGHRHIVLGAWGCGVFRNRPEDIAHIFRSLLGRGCEFEAAFEEVVFSVMDHTRNLANFRAFEVLKNTE